MAEQSIRGPSEMNFEEPAKNWLMWKQKFEIVLTAANKNGEEESLKVALFLHHIGERGIEIFNALALPEGQRTLAIVMTRFENSCIQRRNTVMETFKFGSITQKTDQSFVEFETEVRNQAKFCEFTCSAAEGCDQSYVDRMIKDKIILGLENKKLRSKLLESSQDTLEQIIEKCKIAELSETNKKILNTEEDVIKVETIKNSTMDKVKQPYMNRQKNIQTCERCGMTSSGQHERFCPALVEGRRCRTCHKPGHFAVMCRKKYSGRRLSSSNYVQAVGAEEREQRGESVRSTQSADQQRGIQSVNIDRQYYDDALDV